MVQLWDYRPSFGSFHKLSETDLFSTSGPHFELVSVGHAHDVEVQITPSSSTSPSSALSIGIFAAIFPAWYFAAVASRMTVSWVVCMDPSNWEFFKIALPTSIPLLSMSEAQILDPVHIIAVNDVSMRSFHTHLWNTAVGCPLMIFDTTTRRPPPHLHSRRVRLHHTACGGVTNGGFNFTCVSPSLPAVLAFGSFRFPTYPNDGLISILSRTSGGTRRGFNPSRVPAIGSSSKVMQVFDDNPGLFFGHGLCPLVPDLHLLQFICPCVYPTTPWVRRGLTVHELGMVFDLPASFTQRLGSIKLNALTRLLRVPIKPMTVMFLHLFRYAWPSSPLAPSNDDSAGCSSTSESDNRPGGGCSFRAEWSSFGYLSSQCGCGFGGKFDVSIFSKGC